MESKKKKNYAVLSVPRISVYSRALARTEGTTDEGKYNRFRDNSERKISRQSSAK